MVKFVVVGEMPARILSDLVGAFDVQVVAQIGPEDMEWGKAVLNKAPYQGIVAGRGLPDGVLDRLEALALQKDTSTFVRYRPGLDAAGVAQGLGAQPVTETVKFVISFNNKGGTGKSTLALNAAVRLANRGVRTLLLDDDVQNGDLAHYLEMPSDIPHMGDLMQLRERTLEPNDVRQAVTHVSRYGFDLLPSPPNPTGSAEFTMSQVWSLAVALMEMHKDYDVVVIDSPPGLTAGTLTQVLLRDRMVSIAMLPFTDNLGGIKGFKEARTLILEQVPRRRIIPVLMRISPDTLKEPNQIPEIQDLNVIEVPYYSELARTPILQPNGSVGFVAQIIGAVMGRSESATSIAFETLGQRLAQTLAEM